MTKWRFTIYVGVNPLRTHERSIVAVKVFGSSAKTVKIGNTCGVCARRFSIDGTGIVGAIHDRSMRDLQSQRLIPCEKFHVEPRCSVDDRE